MKLINKLFRRIIVKNNHKLVEKLNEEINPYYGINFLKPIKCDVIDDSFEKDIITLKFSVIIPVKNEEKSIVEYIRSISNQTALPDEVIFVDHNSTDKTVEIIQKIAKHIPLEMKVISCKESQQFKTTHRATLAGNRNLGVSKARNEFILFTDCGNVLPKNYFRSLIGPINKNQSIDLVGGIYKTQSKTLDKILTFNWDYVDWNSFLPACRGQVIKKSLYIKCGGQPEWVTYAAEDAFYDFNYRKESQYWVFNKNALITWIAPKDNNEIKEKFFAYGIGDGETGLGNSWFNSNTLKSVSDNICEKAKYLGFLLGKNNRSTIDKCRGIKGIAFVFVKNPIVLSQNSIEIVKTCIANKQRTICIICDPEFSKISEKYIDVDFSLLEMYSWSKFKIEEFIRIYAKTFLHNNISFFVDEKNISEFTIHCMTETKNIIESLNKEIDINNDN